MPEQDTYTDSGSTRTHGGQQNSMHTCSEGVGAAVGVKSGVGWAVGGNDGGGLGVGDLWEPSDTPTPAPTAVNTTTTARTTPRMMATLCHGTEHMLGRFVSTRQAALTPVTRAAGDNVKLASKA